MARSPCSTMPFLAATSLGQAALSRGSRLRHHRNSLASPLCARRSPPAPPGGSSRAKCPPARKTTTLRCSRGPAWYPAQTPAAARAPRRRRCSTTRSRARPAWPGRRGPGPRRAAAVAEDQRLINEHRPRPETPRHRPAPRPMQVRHRDNAPIVQPTPAILSHSRTFVRERCRMMEAVGGAVASSGRGKTTRSCFRSAQGVPVVCSSTCVKLTFPGKGSSKSNVTLAPRFLEIEPAVSST